MQFYQFEVLRGEDVISVEPSVPLHNTRAAWPKIIRMAKGLELPGCHIRVREQSGETIILVGAAAALRYADFTFRGLRGYVRWMACVRSGQLFNTTLWASPGRVVVDVLRLYASMEGSRSARWDDPIPLAGVA